MLVEVATALILLCQPNVAPEDCTEKQAFETARIPYESMVACTHKAFFDVQFRFQHYRDRDLSVKIVCEPGHNT